ncbi:hypothetical protein [Streptomyces chrestomyceticus]|uniref:hypothetical protein n=1 Tax=Streptomyces chrestomyceticus TaxID=68185 RepID=UPI0033C0EC74
MSADIYVIKPRWVVQAPYLRTTLRRALEFQATQNVWSDAEHVNNATSMIHGNEITDTGPWEFTKSQLSTLVAAIKWRRGKHATWDRMASPDIRKHWAEIEGEIIDAYRSACHADGAQWV